MSRKKPMKAAKTMEPEQTNEILKDEFACNGLPKKDLLVIQEVAAYLRVDDRTIRDWKDQGFFDERKLHGSIRITRDSVVKFVKESRVYRCMTENKENF